MKKPISDLYSIKSVTKHLAETLDVDSPLYAEVTNLYHRAKYLLQKETKCLGTITICLNEAVSKQKETKKLMRQTSKNQSIYQSESARLTEEINFLTKKKNQLISEGHKLG